MTGRTRILARAAALGVAALLLSGAPAHADNGGTTTETGYGAKVEVRLSGDVSQALRGSVPGPPPMCWWEDLSTTLLDPGALDTSDPKAVQEYYDKEVRPWLTGHAGMGVLTMPDAAYFKDVIRRAAAGEKLRFYSLKVRDGAVSGKPGDDSWATDTNTVAKACGASTNDSAYGPMLVNWRAFPAGQPPPPAVSDEDLAAYAYEVMDLKRPALEWNPHLAAADDATLVNLPTWLWTRDPAAVAVREVTAEAAGVSVTVTARPGGMTVTSPAAGTECSAAQARTAYASGVDPASACVLTFPSASFAYPGGFPVQATTGWGATWTSSEGPGGDLEAKTMAEVTQIPVIEVQSRVSGVS